MPGFASDGPAAAATPVSGTLARLRIALAYRVRHLRRPDLQDPRRFTELVQIRKLHDRSPLHPLLMDKLAAKARARQVLGDAWVIPTLWAGARLPEQPPFAFPAILKARHGCNQYAVLPEDPGARSWRRLQRRALRWSRRPYGLWLDEWAYRHVARGLLAEPLLGDAGMLPIDYKIYVFGGRATHVQVHLDRGQHHRWILHDRA